MAKKSTERGEAKDRLAALAAVAKKSSAFRPARQVLKVVRSVPTIFPSIDIAMRVDGWPIDRAAVVHGPSGVGKTYLTNGIGLSFLKREHFFKLIDAERCYDAATDVLTRRGFLPWSEVSQHDELGCWDPIANSLVYEKPLELTKHRHDGPMYRVNHGGVDLLVTEHHKMFVQTIVDSKAGGIRNVTWSDWNLVQASDLGDRLRVRYQKCAPYRLRESIDLSSGDRSPVFPAHDDSRALLRLIGFFVGDGWVGKTTEITRPRVNSICFGLKKQRKVAYLREICAELGWEVEEQNLHAQGHRVYTVHAPAIGSLFRRQFYDENDEKIIPSYLLDLNVEDSSALLDGLRSSDGTAKRGAWEFSTTSNQVAEALQRIVLHAGGAAHIHRFPSGLPKSDHHKQMIRVMVLSRMTEPIVNAATKKNTTYENYTGDVFCAHTRTGILVVRRNGKPVLSGNTTPITWMDQLFGSYADHPGFSALRPKTYEEAVVDVRTWATAIGDAKAKNRLPKDVTGIAVVDSVRKLVPKSFFEKVMKAEAEEDGKKKGTRPNMRTAKPKGIDGVGGRSSQMKAHLHALWLDELTGLLDDTGTAIILITREHEDPDADFRDKAAGRNFKVSGGTALIYDSSMLLRVERTFVWGPGKKDERTPVYGESHKVTIRKSKVAGMQDREEVGYFCTSNGLLVPAGFDRARDVIRLGKEHDVVKGDAWLSWHKNRWNGEHRAVAALTEKPEMIDEMEREIREAARAEA